MVPLIYRHKEVNNFNAIVIIPTAHSSFFTIIKKYELSSDYTGDTSTRG